MGALLSLWPGFMGPHCVTPETQATSLQAVVHNRVKDKRFLFKNKRMFSNVDLWKCVSTLLDLLCVSLSSRSCFCSRVRDSYRMCRQSTIVYATDMSFLDPGNQSVPDDAHCQNIYWKQICYFPLLTRCTEKPPKTTEVNIFCYTQNHNK